MYFSESNAAQSVRFTGTEMVVMLRGGRTLQVQLTWFPVLEHATSEQRLRVEISPSGNGLHWKDLDEDISVARLLAGTADLTNRRVPRKPH